MPRNRALVTPYIIIIIGQSTIIWLQFRMNKFRGEVIPAVYGEGAGSPIVSLDRALLILHASEPCLGEMLPIHVCRWGHRTRYLIARMLLPIH